MTRDFSRTLWHLRKSSQTARAGSFYLREAANAGLCPSDATQVEGSCFVEVGPVVPPWLTEGPPDQTSVFANAETASGDLYSGASADLSHVLFFLRRANSGQSYLWPGDTTTEHLKSLYEYVGVGDAEPKLVGVSNAGQLLHNTEADLISDCGTELGGAETTGNDKYNAISASGQAVFFTARAAESGPSKDKCTFRELPLFEEGTGPPVDELYVRIAGEETLAISEPPLSVQGRECTGTCETSETIEADRSKGVFQGASEDGSKVFFLTKQPLVNAGADTKTDLYMRGTARPDGQERDRGLPRPRTRANPPKSRVWHGFPRTVRTCTSSPRANSQATKTPTTIKPRWAPITSMCTSATARTRRAS